jgi:tetratricopeptide (TPR) repeat protein
MLKRYVEATDDLNKAIGLGFNTATAFYNRGLSLYNRREYAAALNDFVAASGKNPGDMNSWTMYGHSLCMIPERRGTAPDVYAKAIALGAQISGKCP